MTRHAASPLSAIAIFILAAASLPLAADSHVRIVRLSSVEGQVQMDRGDGSGLERAILNAPIVEGTSLVTGSDGLAEVEFENQSALRLTSNSEVKFAQLLLSDAGAKINQIVVVKGLVYLDAASKGDDVYRLIVGDQSFLVRRDSQIRLSTGDDKVQLAVFKGDVQLENQPQPVHVGRKETLTLDTTTAAGYLIAKSVDAVNYDRWNQERQDYSKTYAENEGYGGPNRGYGLQDLNYYGGYLFAPGYGYVWQPYGFSNAMAGWSPYSNGAWMFYPGLGYSWASAYPWGWLPFHYGSWAFINGLGWAWLPGAGYGGQWYASNFQNVPKVTKAPAGWTPTLPPATSANSARPTVVVGNAGAKPLSVPGGRIPPKFGSVVPGRTTAAATSNSFAKPNAQALTAGHGATGAASAANLHSSSHVFAPRATVVPSFGAGEFGGGYGSNGSRGMGASAAGTSHSSSSVSAAHASPSAGAGGSSTAHK